MNTKEVLQDMKTLMETFEHFDEPQLVEVVKKWRRYVVDTAYADLRKDQVIAELEEECDDLLEDLLVSKLDLAVIEEEEAVV